MDFNKVMKFLLTDVTSIDFDVITRNEEELVIRANISAAQLYDDEILTKITVRSSGTVHITFTFDRIDKTANIVQLAIAYNLINDFNDNSDYLYGYLSEKDGGTFFELHAYSLKTKDEREVVDAILFILAELLEENTVKYLKPITEITVQ